MFVLTGAQMREADEYTIKELGVPSLTLMERAGVALAEEAERLAPTGKILCVCGGGNNGGDGFVCARILMERGREVEAVFFAKRASTECATNKEKFERLGGRIFADIPETAYALIVDCLLGTGFHGEVSSVYADVIAKMNARASGKVLSADIPSGVNGENGKGEIAVKADRTLCIGELKTGVFLDDGIDYSGEVARADIGIVLPKNTYATLMDRAEVKKRLPVRKRNSHKGSYGKAAIVAGSEAYTGAAYLATAACLRSGVGYTTLFTPKDILPYYVLKAPEALIVSLNDGGRVAFNEENFQKLLGFDAISYGMGTGVSEAVAQGAKYLLSHFQGRLVLDADAINSLAVYEKENFKSIFGTKKCDVVLTPHYKEFSRMTGESVIALKEKGLSAPQAFAREYGVTVLLKNAVSLLADKTYAAVNTSGTSGQAKGGSGDVLSGVSAGLCAHGMSAFDGAFVGAYLVGKAADIAVETQGERAVLASDTIACLGKAFLYCE